MQSIKQQSNFVNLAFYNPEWTGKSLAANSVNAADLRAYIVASVISSNSLFAPIAGVSIVITFPLWKQIQNSKFTSCFTF